ncbi:MULTISPECIES: hypothetical protein [unclassified Myroides]|uniref:hypothetical protein n=1 Tax=unclassified Myroides TaxID=2642485 RepID=UPI003D2F8390
MAVKPEKIKERLKVLFPKANLSQKRLDEISARLAKKPEDDAEDDAIDQVINDANDLMDFAAIAKEDDRIRTLEAKSKAPETTDPKKEEKKEEGDDAPAWAKALIQKVEAIEKGEVVKSKQSTVTDLFAKSEVLKSLPEAQKQSWMNRVNLESEDLSAEIASLETEYSELKQSVVDSMGFSGVPSYNSVGGKDISDAAVDAILDGY